MLAEDGSGAMPRAFIDERDFSLEEMRAKNRLSLALDGVEDIRDGCLVYTDALLDKTKRVFGAHVDVLDYRCYYLVLLLNLSAPPGVV